MDCSTPGLPVHHQLLESTEAHDHWIGDTIQPSHPLLSPAPPDLIFPSIRVFSNEPVLCIGWPKYWSFSFRISPSNEYSGLISFTMDWLDLFAVQGTLKSLLQHHSSKASILQRPAFFIVQLSHPHMTTGKTIALTTWNFVGKVMSLLLNMLSRLVITFLPRSKRLFFFLMLFFFFNYLTLQYCIGFAIYQHESTTGIHMLPILNPPPSSLSIPSLWVVPVHQPQASSIVHRTWTGDSFHMWYYTCFNAILPNLPTLSLSYRVQKTVLYIHQCLFCCLVYRVIVTIFLNSIYMH